MLNSKSKLNNNKTVENGNKPKMLLIAMPKADSSFYEMNIAQLPQGPRLHILEWILKRNKIPRQIRRKIRMFTGLENIFNPKRKTPYLGLRLIEQNLRKFIDIKIVEYPKSDRWVVKYLKKNTDLNIIGISIGCENRVYHAKKLASKIRKAIPEIKIVFGNYGASAGKRLGLLTDKEGSVLWDSEEERKNKREEGKDFYKGEGVHDIKLWLRDVYGFFAGEPNGPLLSEAVSDSGVSSARGLGQWVKSIIGFVTMPKDSHKLVSAIGCSNNCDFCNSSKIFNREKTYLYQDAKRMFSPMEKVYDANFKREDFPPEATFFIMDENFMKDERVNSPSGIVNFIDVAEELCGFVEKSKKNIHFGTFSDIKSLLNIRNKYGNFNKLVRGGITSIWVGIESREDVFGKRGEATPEVVKSIVTDLQNLGIVVIGSFIPGLPYHTESKTMLMSDEIKNKEEKEKNGGYELLNIWDDFAWWKDLETGARQVMSHSITGVVGGHSHMFKFSDYEFGHKSIPGYNCSKISGKRLEEIDELLREKFYEENGPVALSSLLVMWNGFMNLKGSDNEAEIRTATFNYWMAKRNRQRVVLSSFLFNYDFFTECSTRFLSRLAKMLKELDEYSPPDTEINRKYDKVFKLYDERNSKISKDYSNKLCKRFIKRNL